jgi:PPOX class probable F420-dependent enzyme
VAAIDLTHVQRLLGLDLGLGVVSVARPDGTVASSFVNCGLFPHPVTDETTLAFVVRENAYKTRRLRRDPRLTVTVTARWEWQAVEGTATLIGPRDPHPQASTDIPTLLREVFRAAGGTHEDWDEYDRVMAAEQRLAVLVTPTRVYGNVNI